MDSLYGLWFMDHPKVDGLRLMAALKDLMDQVGGNFKLKEKLQLLPCQMSRLGE